MIHYEHAGSDKTTGAMDVKDNLDLSLKDKELRAEIAMTYKEPTKGQTLS